MSNDNHGSTPAAWTLVVIVMAGFIVGAAGLLASSPTLFWIGVGLVPVGGLVSYVMKLMGLGVKKSADLSRG